MDTHDNSPVVLECIPFANNTSYDYLTSIERRARHENVPEPELITWFDKKGTIKHEELVNRLLKLKEQVSGFFLKAVVLITQFY